MKKILLFLYLLSCLIFGSLIPVTAAGIDPNSPNLVAYWKFEQNALDSTANRNNGSITGPVSWTPSIQGYGITLSGTNNFVTCQDSSSLNIQGNLITIEAWIKFSAIQDGVICAKYQGNNGYALRTEGGKLSFFSGTTWSLSTGTVNDGNWHYVVVTGNGSAGAFYIDAQPSGTFTYTAIRNNAGAPLYIGCNEGAGCFAGNIDELAIWKKALTQAEIQSHYYNLQGIVAYWKLEKNLLDSTTNHNNGSLTGAPFWANGIQGNSLALSGTSNYVICPDSASLNIQGNITIEAWIKASTIQDGVICAKYQGNHGYALRIQGGKLSFFSGATWSLSTGTVNDGTWHYVVVTGNGSYGVFYIDGQFSGSFAYSAIANNAGAPLYIGCNEGIGCFTGNIDELAIWNRALTQPEIQSHYGLAAWWKFDQTVFDSTPNRNNGNITGTASWMVGIRSKSIVLSGTNNYVTCPASASLNIQSNITIEAWIKTSGTQDGVICAKYQGNNGYALRTQGGQLSFFFGGATWPLSTGTVNDGNWHYVAVTGNGSIGAFYIDGQPSGTFAYSAIVNNIEAPLYIGCNEGAGCFAGNLDELAIWNRALTFVEIQNHYGMLGYWKFERNVLDFSPNHNNGNITGTVSWPASVDGNAIVLSGTNNYVTCPASASLNIRGNITIEGWVKTSGAQDGVICAKYQGNNGFALRTQGGKLSFFSGTTWSLSNGTVNDANWHYVAVTGYGAMGAYYIDGQPSGTFTYSPIAYNAGLPLELGCYQGAGCFAGSLDELAFWNRPLTAVEIQRRYNNYLNPQSTVYMSGYYQNGDRLLPCYWTGMNKTDLPSGDAKYGYGNSIYVYDNTVYTAGSYSHSDGNLYTPCYWKGTERIILSLDGAREAYANSIYVDNGNGTVYTAGYYNNGSVNMPCYWSGAAKHNLPADFVGYAVSIYAYGATVYIAGQYGNGTHCLPCYWIVTPTSTTRITLPVLSDGWTNSICVYDGAVYVAGSYYDGVSKNIPCYWKGMERIDLPINGAIETNPKSIYVCNDTVYVTGWYYNGITFIPCYWTTTTRTELPGSIGYLGALSYSIYIFGGTVYTAGHCPNDYSACYWRDTALINLPDYDAGVYSIFVK
jgi:uncharacterized protein YcnI